MLQEHLQLYMDSVARGKENLPDYLARDFGEACAKAIARQWNPKDAWRLRMSGVGGNWCEQRLARMGIKGEIDYSLPIKLLLGDIVEAIMMVIIEASGLKIQSFQQAVSLDTAGRVLKGTLDIKLHEKIWDIKSAFPTSFVMKFGDTYGGYQKLRDNDPFGYVVQGYLYSTAAEAPFGGWIVINKVTGEIAVLEAPEYNEKEREEAIMRAEENIEKIMSDEPFVVPFKDIPEVKKLTVNKRKVEAPTGNRLLPSPCGWCKFKRHCWPECEVHKSIAKGGNRAPMVWYSKLRNKVRS